MPNNVAQVPPASGAVTMLHLALGCNWTPVTPFYSGSDMPADDYGDYYKHVINTWEYPTTRLSARH